MNSLSMDHEFRFGICNYIFVSLLNTPSSHYEWDRIGRSCNVGCRASHTFENIMLYSQTYWFIHCAFIHCAFIQQVIFSV